MILSHPAPSPFTTEPHIYTPPQLVDEVAGVYRQWHWEGHRLALWTGQATPAQIERFTKHRPSYREKHPRAEVHVVTSGMNLPDGAARTAWGDALSLQLEEITCIAVVVEGGGFWSSAMRGAVTGVAMLVPKMRSVMVASSIGDVVARLPSEHRRLGGDPLDPSGLRSALLAVR